jgi:hypothetical protein
MLLLAGCGGSSDDDASAGPSAVASGTAEPSDEPSPEPSDVPSEEPSGEPSGEPTSEPDESAAPSAEPSDDAMPLTKAQAKRLAAAAILRKADLPGYTATQAEPDDGSGDELLACLETKEPTYLVHNFGTGYTKGGLEIDSSADVAKSVSAARKEMAAYTSDKALRCVKGFMMKTFADTGAKVSNDTTERVDPKIPGADGAFGFRVAVTLSGPGGTTDLTMLVLGALVGQVEIALSSVETNSSDFTLENADALLATSVRRVRALH